MKDPVGEIRTTFHTLLDGNLSCDSTNFAVFKNIPLKPPNEYAYISAIGAVDNSGKDHFLTDCSIELTAYIRNIAFQSRYIDIDDIMNDISLLVQKKSITFTNYYMVTTPTMIASASNEYEEDGKLIAMRTTTYSFKLQEK